MFTVITDHVNRAIGHLIGQYKGVQTMEGTVAALNTPVQDVEYALNSLNTLRSVFVATGINLDNIGGIVGITRVPGQDDTSYRLAILARIQINRSMGTPQNIIQAFQLLTGATECLFDEFYPAAIMMESTVVFPTQVDVDEIINGLRGVVAGGVRVEGIVTYDPSEAFAFDGNLPGFGFGDATDPTAGGLFATLNSPGGYFAFDGDDPAGLGFGTTEDSLVGGLFVSL